ncbi:AMSH-like ubiquitin thioesterase 2 [Bidens hawaiensis]|uniref:AMSH-like ubiquitin thioesterase 2 n=1 Tax=Bidens hawaiensis TaxID=980011 RepID=UPI00404B8239
MNKTGLMQPTLCKVTHSYPSPIISCIHKDPHGSEVSRITTPSFENRHSKSLVDGSTASNGLKDVHISTQLLDGFLDLAIDNTSKDLETCGVLGAFLKEGTYYVTTLIIPKQDSTSSSCQAVHEEEIFAIQNEQSLFPVGWIHTHPSQSCFMSSVDLHTQYSYQVMVPEAVAIVMAPTDTSRSFGFFRLSDPYGMNVLRECQQTGFHTHKEPVSGTSIYEDCTSIYLNPNLRLEICDLRE